MKYALFAYRNEQFPRKTTLPDRRMLFDQLQARDVEPVVSVGAEAAFTDTGVEAGRLIDEHTVEEMGCLALDEIGVVVNRLDRSFRETPSQQPSLPTAWVDAGIARVNENSLRSLVYRKARVYHEVFKPLGVGIPTRLIQGVDDLDAFLADHETQGSFIVKPNSGTFSQGVEALTREELLAQPIEELLGSSSDKYKIIQPQYDFTHPFPSSIQAYDKASEEGFGQLRRPGIIKELRMYAFKGPDTFTATFPVARTMRDGVDHWIFIDPESVPRKLHDRTVGVLDASARLTGSRAILAALDFGYGAPHNNTQADPDFHEIELNGRMPYLVGADKHADIAMRLRGHFADLIRSTIEYTEK